MQLIVEIESHFNDDEFTHFTVWADTTKRALQDIEGVAKAKPRGRGQFEVWKSPRYFPGTVEHNIRTAFEAQEG